MKRFLDARVAGLFPGYFSLCMATGIVSIACWLEGMRGLATALLFFNVPAYAILFVLTVLRAVLYRERMAADLSDHGRAPGFFTTVAATSVLGTQVLTIMGDASAPSFLWIAAISLWAIVTYGFFAIVTVKQDKPPIEAGLNGSWLLAVVATQSIVVLGSLLAPERAAGGLRDASLFFCLCMFFVGCVFYLILITLILYRFLFFRFTSVQLTPPYWINMGAVAITTVAGASLLGARPLSPLLEVLAPFLTGLTVAFWAIATWWIPLLLILGAWRHGIERVRLEYDPQYWGMVFPLGMYTTATVRLAALLEATFLLEIAHAFVFVAIAAWTLTFAGFVHGVARRAPRAGA